MLLWDRRLKMIQWKFLYFSDILLSIQQNKRFYNVKKKSVGRVLRASFANCTKNRSKANTFTEQFISNNYLLASNSQNSFFYLFWCILMVLAMTLPTDKCFTGFHWTFHHRWAYYNTRPKMGKSKLLWASLYKCRTKT